MDTVVRATTDSSSALTSYLQRVWKVSNYWREPPGEKSSPPSSSVKKILIVLSDTGGGHKASANALSAALNELRPEGVEIKIVDVLEDYTLWFSNRLYNVSQQRCIHLFCTGNRYLWQWWVTVPEVWGTIYHTTKQVAISVRPMVSQQIPNGGFFSQAVLL